MLHILDDAKTKAALISFTRFCFSNVIDNIGGNKKGFKKKTYCMYTAEQYAHRKKEKKKKRNS